jgi:hypothetical protein
MAATTDTDDDIQFENQAVRAAYDEMMCRLMSSAMGLPRICMVHKCRRRHRCFGAGQPCLRIYSGVVAARFDKALALLCGSRK